MDFISIIIYYNGEEKENRETETINLSVEVTAVFAMCSSDGNMRSAEWDESGSLSLVGGGGVWIFGLTVGDTKLQKWK